MSRELGPISSLPKRDCSILAWVAFSGSATPNVIFDGENVASITDDGGAGLWTVNWSRAIARSTDYAVMGLARRALPIGNVLANLVIRKATYLTTTSVSVDSFALNGLATTDADYVSLVAVGAP